MGSQRVRHDWVTLCHFTLLACGMSAIVQYFKHSLALPFFGIGMKTDLFQSRGHCWVFQICWYIECSTFTVSSFRIWNSSTRIPLALFIVMLPKPHLTSYSRMSGSTWVITPSWLSGSWRSFLYQIRSDQISRSVMSNSLRSHESQHTRPPCPTPTHGVHWDSRPLSQWCHPAISSSVVPFSSCPQSLPASEYSSVYSWHLFLISSASVRSIPFWSFIEPIFSWYIPLVSLILLKISLVFPILLFFSISLHWSLRKVFLSLLASPWNFTFKWEQWPHKRLTHTCPWVSRSLHWRCGSAMDCYRVGDTECSSVCMGPIEGGAIIFITFIIVWPQVNNREGTQPCPSTENWINSLLSMAPPIRTRPSFPLSQSPPSGSLHKPLIFLHQRPDRLKTTITGN